MGATATAAALAVTVLAGGARAGGSVETRSYVVQRGDTVWAIAERLAGPTGDPRPVVDRIEALNHLRGSALGTGQRILLPAS